MGSEKLKDKYYMAYVLFYGLGTLTQLPANFFLTATDYWMYKFRDPSIENYSNFKENRTALQAQFTADFSIVSHVTMVVFAALTIVFIRKLGVIKRVTGCLGGIIIIFAMTNVFVQQDTDSWQTGFFVYTLITGCFLTGLSGIFLVTLLEIIMKFPPGYLAVVLIGQSICGILAALIQIICLAIGANSVANGFIYFHVGMCFVLMNLMYFLLILKKSDFFVYHLYKEIAVDRPKITKEALLTVLNKIKIYILAMLIVCGASAMVQPGVTSLVVSVNKGNGNKWNDVFFVPVITFLVHHICDFIGKELARKVKKPHNAIIILIVSLCRVAFIPLLMLCNAHPRHNLPVVFNEDYAYIIFIILFAFTNGYFMNLCVVNIPLVTTEEEMRIASVFIMIFMMVGMGGFSFLGAVLVGAL